MNVKSRQKTIQTLMPWLATLAFLILWQGGTALLRTSNLTLPAPSTSTLR